MSTGNPNSLTKEEITELIASVIASSMHAHDVYRGQVVKQTTVLHMMNLSDKGKAFLVAGADLTLAVVDAGISIPAAFFKSEILVPSLEHSSLLKWLRAEKRTGQDVILNKVAFSD